jgi:hypothetical protein
MYGYVLSELAEIPKEAQEMSQGCKMVRFKYSLVFAFEPEHMLTDKLLSHSMLLNGQKFMLLW